MTQYTRTNLFNNNYEKKPNFIFLKKIHKQHLYEESKSGWVGMGYDRKGQDRLD
jgi:hypothetical protein